MATSKFYAVIVAGGNGSRMNYDIPKQFILLEGIPIIMHTIKKFYNHKLQPKIVVVLGNDFINNWNELIEKYNFSIPHIVVNGGKERFHSVKNTLHLFDENSVIAIHDAVRPFISHDLITNCYLSAEKMGNAIPSVDSRDSVRFVNVDGTSSIIKRNKVKLIQTPQVFKFNQLKSGYEVDYKDEFTDDASVIENANFKVNLISGEYNNIKITFREDLEFAKVFIKCKELSN